MPPLPDAWYDHSHCPDVHYRLRTDLYEAREEIKKLKLPAQILLTPTIGPDGWPIYEDKPSYEAVVAENANLKESKEREKNAHEEVRADSFNRLEINDSHISVLKAELEVAQKDLAEARKGGAPPPGQLEIAQGQLLSLKNKEIKWAEEKTELEKTNSSYKTQLDGSLETASNAAASITKLETKISNQSKQINSLLQVSKQKGDEIDSLKRRANGGHHERGRRAGEEAREDDERRAELRKAQGEIERLRGLLEKAEREKIVRAREVEEEMKKLDEEWREEKAGLLVEVDQSQSYKGLLEKAQRNLEDELDSQEWKEREHAQEVAWWKEEWRLEREKLQATENGHAEKVAKLEAQWKVQRESLETAGQHHAEQAARATEEWGNERETFRAEVKGALEAKKRAEERIVELEEAWNVDKGEELAERVHKLRVNEYDLQTALDEARTRYEIAGREIDRMRRIELARKDNVVTRSSFTEPTEADLEAQQKVAEAERAIADLRQRVQELEHLEDEKTDWDFKRERMEADVKSLDRLNGDLLILLRKFQGSEEIVKRVEAKVKAGRSPEELRRQQNILSNVSGGSNEGSHQGSRNSRTR